MAQHSTGTMSEPGVTDDRILLATIMDYTGPNREFGLHGIAGLKSALHRINSHGGVYGRRIELMEYDHASDPSRVPALARKVVEEDRAFAAIFNFGAEQMVTVKDYFTAQKFPNLLPGSMGNVWFRSGRYHLSDCIPQSDMAGLVIDHLVLQRRAGRITLIYQNCESGRNALAATRERMKLHGRSLAGEVGFDYEAARAGSDLKADAERAVKSGADAVFIFAESHSAAKMLGNIHALGWKPEVILAPNSTWNTTIELAREAAEGVSGMTMYPLPLDPGYLMNLYREDMRKHFPELKPGALSTFGYIKGILFAEAARRVGYPLTRERLLDSLESIRDFDPGLGYTYGFGGPDNRTLARSARLMIVKEGSWQANGAWVDLRARA